MNRQTIFLCWPTKYPRQRRFVHDLRINHPRRSGKHHNNFLCVQIKYPFLP
ncbi:Uncharacterised protein [Vibrio cholerae]|nr:Uncharacterised protein [Vibrio cholerae]